MVNEGSENKEEGRKTGLIRKLRPDMIRRMEDVEPKLINPSGFAVPLKIVSTTHSGQPGHLTFTASVSSHERHSKPGSRRNSIGYDGEGRRYRLFPRDYVYPTLI